MSIKLRVHHLFCCALFQGKGYSSDFVSNMQSVVDRLFSENPVQAVETIELCTTPDLICSACPNLIKGACSLDDNNVISKDVRLLEELGLKCNMAYDRETLIKAVSEAMTEEIFEHSCHNCRWYKEGLCSYQLLEEKYSSFYGET